jgi:hypothetical protein
VLADRHDRMQMVRAGAQGAPFGRSDGEHRRSVTESRTGR